MTNGKHEGLGDLIDAVVDKGEDWAVGGGWYVEETDVGGIVIQKYGAFDHSTNEPVDGYVVADIHPDHIDTEKSKYE